MVYPTNEIERCWSDATLCWLRVLVAWLAFMAHWANETPVLAGDATEDNSSAAVSGSVAAANGDAIAEGATALPAPVDAEVIARISRHMRTGWAEAGLKASGRATDGEWCRRVYLDLIGRVPTAEETTAFLADRRSDRRERLVAQLLDAEEYAEEYARNWTVIWTNLLIGRRGGSEPRSMVNRAGLEQYLRRSFLRNKPCDKLAEELVGAEGVNTPGEEDYNGAVNFILSGLEDNAIQATAKTARIFLGVQIQCTQCHPHPFDEGKQSQFWGLNAFFRQAQALRTMDGNDILSVRLADGDYAGSAGDPRDAPLSFEERAGTMAMVYPTFLDGTRLEKVSGLVRDCNRRDELAAWIARSDSLALATVNRYWAHFFGYGFTRPVDDLRPQNPPSHPELLAELARDFRATGCDLKRLQRWLVLSEPYGLSSVAGEGNLVDDPATGETPRFSRYYVRQMTAEQLYESLLAVTAADRSTRESPEEQAQRRNDWLQQFVIAFGTDEGDEATTFEGTIPQTLMLMNGELMARATRASGGTLLARISAGSASLGEKIQRLYLAAYSRRPTRKELQLDEAMVRDRAGDEEAALADIWWSLLNSSEFLFQH